MQTKGGREKQREGNRGAALGKLPPHLLVHDVTDAAVSCRLGPQSRISSPPSLWTFISALFVSACIPMFYLCFSLSTYCSPVGNCALAQRKLSHGHAHGKSAVVHVALFKRL